MDPTLLVQLNHYNYLRYNAEFRAAAAANKIVDGMATYGWGVYVAEQFVEEHSIPPLPSVTGYHVTLIKRYLAFCEKWTSEHI